MNWRGKRREWGERERDEEEEEEEEEGAGGRRADSGTWPWSIDPESVTLDASSLFLCLHY